MKKLAIYILTIGWTALIFRLTTTPNLVVAPESWLNAILMSGAHFVFFGTEAILLNLAIYDMRNTKHFDSIAIILTSFYGLLIELIQRGIPGRTADPIDWLLDTLGAIAFLYLFKKLKI